MIPTSRVLWGEGLFIRPQHFQQQDAYHDWRLTQAMSTLHPYAWGVRSLQVDTDALATGRLRLLELRLVLPDGEAYNAPAQDELPEPMVLAPLFEHSGELVIHAALAPLRGHGGNLAHPEQAGDARYFQIDRDTPDQFTQAASAPISVLGKSLRLVAAPPGNGHVSVPLLRVRRNASGGFEHDPRFIPPCTSVSASPGMLLHARRLLDVLQAKVEALYEMHRQPSKQHVEFRAGDAASFWLLHTASSAFASLSHLVHHPLLHPERLFQQLLALAGALLTFSRSHTLGDLPAYKHDDPGPAFFKLNQIIRELLETVISTRFMAIPLHEAQPFVKHGRLDAPQIGESTRFYLGASATLPPSELVETIPSSLKVGAPEDVDRLLVSSMAGVEITHAPQVPAAIPVRPSCYYFALEPHGPLYERMLQSRTLAVYVPPGIPDLQLELIALT